MTTHHSLAFLDIDLVANDDLLESVHIPASTWYPATYKWEALRVHWAGLNQKLVAPAVQGIETLRVVDIVDEHAAVGASVKSNT
jgi:hypothetical protein